MNLRSDMQAMTLNYEKSKSEHESVKAKLMSMNRQHEAILKEQTQI